LRAASGVRDLNGSYLPTWAGFWDHVLAHSYNAFFAENALAASLAAPQWLQLVINQTGWLGLTLAALGLAWLFDRRWRPARAWWLVLAVLLTNLIFAIFYRVPDPEVFLLPALLCLAIFSGGGVGLLARLLPNLHATILSLILLAILIAIPFGRGPIANRRHEWAAHDQARRLAQANFPPGSQVLGLEGEMTALRYMQAAEGLGTNATPINANDPTQRRALVEQLVASGAPLYLTREVEGISEAYSFSGEADLVRVWPRGESQVTLPTMNGPETGNGETGNGESLGLASPLLLDNGRVQIEAYTLRPIAGLAQPAHELTLYWRVLSPTDKILKLSLRLLDSSGTPYEWPPEDGQGADQEGRPAVEDRFPLRQVALTPSWLPGELVQDVHTIWLPPTLDPSRLHSESPTLLAIIYDSATALEEGRIEIMF
jgi:hypothetical protein